MSSELLTADGVERERLVKVQVWYELKQQDDRERKDRQCNNGQQHITDVVVETDAIEMFPSIF